MGRTLPGKYTLQPLSSASISRADPSVTYSDTSAICTPRTNASPHFSRLTASSKSLESSPSMVKSCILRISSLFPLPENDSLKTSESLSISYRSSSSPAETLPSIVPSPQISSQSLTASSGKVSLSPRASVTPSSSVNGSSLFPII